ncbi:hypothetical protein [Paenibacillus planticolens]|nr:hypothetical protein [Paenibacillus planticolens]
MNQSMLLLKKIVVWNEQYDPEFAALRQPLNSNTYHTTLRPSTTPTAHGTYNAAVYATALLDSELPEYEERAFHVIRGLLPHQDQDTQSDTYGIWPWFYEEPLSQMSPPDWNWADFIGKQLVLIALRHGKRIPDDLNEQIRHAVWCACESIVRRNMGAHYTNIAIMGSLVTLIAGEHYGWNVFVDYALDRLKKIQAHVEQLGNFQEYNSPPYTKVAIIELSHIRQATRIPLAKELANSLLDRAWFTVAEHIHPQTMEWAGPHCRSYGALLREDEKGFLQLATQGKLRYYPDDEVPYDTGCYGNDIRCPEDYIPFLIGMEKRVIRQRYYLNYESGLEKWASTYITPAYSIGSFSEEIMWNQTRPVIGYVNHEGKPVYFRFRFLHDGYDYCSAVIKSSQEQGDLLLGVRFLTEGGDTHPNLDRIDGSIQAADFRLRLEFGGHLEGIVPDLNGAEASVKIGDTQVQLRSLYAIFGEESASLAWRVSQDQSAFGLDLVLYEGEPKVIDFHTIQRAALLLSLSLGDELMVPSFQITETEDSVTAALDSGEEEAMRMVSVPLKPRHY